MANELERFATDDGKTYVVVGLDTPMEKALTRANSYFRASKSRLAYGYGWVKDDVLYFEEKKGADKVWIFWRKSANEE